MKKILAIMLATLMLLSFAACGANEEGGKSSSSKGSVMSTDYMTIDGICVDDSYTDKDNSSLKMVYLFYTFNSNEQNLEIDSNFTTMKINDTNSYNSDHYSKDLGVFMPNYYYSSYIEDVSMGNSIKVLATFKIPEADIAAGRTITLSDEQIPDIEDIKFSTDEIKHFDSNEAMAKAMDADGYAKIMELREPADAATVEKVKGDINDYSFSFYVNNSAYTLEFSAPNEFYIVVRVGGSAIDNGGTYEVLKGYIACTYPSNGNTVYIPWEYNDNGEITLDCVAGFDVR